MIHSFDNAKMPDITVDDIEQYRLLSEAAIQDAQTWLRQGALSRAIPEAMPDAVMVTNESGIIVSVNSQFELMFGYHRSEVLGQTPEMLIPDSLREKHAAHRASYADNPRVREMGAGLDLRARRKNGADFKVLVKLGPVVIPDGVFTIVVIRRV